MIHALHTKESFIYAYVVFDTVDKNGKWMDNGDYIYISDMWIHPDFRQKETLAELYTHIYTHPQTGKAKKVYWERSKFEKPRGPYDKTKLFKLGGLYGK
jgi:hypothetical protein